MHVKTDVFCKLHEFLILVVSRFPRCWRSRKHHDSPPLPQPHASAPNKVLPDKAARQLSVGGTSAYAAVPFSSDKSTRMELGLDVRRKALYAQRGARYAPFPIRK